MNYQFGYAWLALSASLAIHVADEALTDFLPLYNRNVMAIRRRIPFLPLPTFRFRIWLGLLLSGTAVLFALSPFAFRAAPWIISASQIFGWIMLANGGWHITASIVMRRWMPGVYSSPLLLAVSTWLLWAARAR